MTFFKDELLIAVKIPWLQCKSGMDNQVHNKGSQVCLVSGWKIKVLEVNTSKTAEENSCYVGLDKFCKSTWEMHQAIAVI